MNRRNALFVQTVVELLIPALGYFSWHWNLNFILLYYFIDLLLVLGLSIAKANKRIVYAGTSERVVFYRLYFASLGIFTAALLLILYSLFIQQPDLDVKGEVLRFLLYKDMGIEQGYVLVPLMLLNGVLLYRQSYLVTARYRVENMTAMLQPLFRQSLVVFAMAAIVFGVSYLMPVPEVVLVFGSIVCISAYRWFFLRM